MGREVRKVPADWEHPKDKIYGEIRYIPMFEGGFEDASKEWAQRFIRMYNGGMTDEENEWYPEGVMEWANEEMPPDPKHYMPEFEEHTKTHFQMYEDTSEGTPISPVMKTPEELAQWLVDNNASTFGHNMTATYEQWLYICNGGWAPSAVVTNGHLESGVVAMSNNESK